LTDWMIIYTTSAFECKYCKEAIELLDCYGISYFVKDITIPEYKEEFKSYGFKTIPQVFLEQELIGGCDDLRKYLRLYHSPAARREESIFNKVKF